MNDLRTEIIFQISKNKLLGFETEIGDFILDYDLENDLLCASSYKKTKKVNPIFIPSVIDKINNACFYNCKKLTWVELGENIKEIGKSAFTNCYRLNVDFSNCRNLDYIGDNAFLSCLTLSCLDIDGVLSQIGDNAFRSSGLENICINSNLSYIGNYAFMHCDYLKNITIKSNNNLYLGVKSFSAMEHKTGFNIIIEAPLIEFGTFSFAFSKINSLVLNCDKVVFNKSVFNYSTIKSFSGLEKNISINNRYITKKEFIALKESNYPVIYENNQLQI